MASKLISNYLPEIIALGLFRSRPAMVTVNLTKRCNQHCIYCEIGGALSSTAKDTLTADDLFWIIDQMAINKIRKISLCGGEPFLFAGIFDVVAYARKKKIRISITTNGMTIHRLSAGELTILKESKTGINISIDSFLDNVQSFTRGNPSALSDSLKSLHTLSESGIPITLLTVISKYNYHGLFAFTKTAFEKGIRQVLFQPVIYYSNYPDKPPLEGKSQLNVSVDKLDVLMDELRKILQFEKNHDIKTNVYRIYPWIGFYLQTAAAQNGTWFFNAVLNKFFCRELHAIIDISYDGGIQPCGLTKASISIINNRQAGLMTLWSEATREIKNELHHDRFYGACNGCCHHFSRNMLASMMKYPVKNRKALMTMIPLIFSRVHSGIRKKLYF